MWISLQRATTQAIFNLIFTKSNKWYIISRRTLTYKCASIERVERIHWRLACACVCRCVWRCRWLIVDDVCGRIWMGEFPNWMTFCCDDICQILSDQISLNWKYYRAISILFYYQETYSVDFSHWLNSNAVILGCCCFYGFLVFA